MVNPVLPLVKSLEYHKIQFKHGERNINGQKNIKKFGKYGRTKEKDVHGLIIHSVQGCQYTPYEYKTICKSNRIQIPISRKGTPIDVSLIECWHALLKIKH